MEPLEIILTITGIAAALFLTGWIVTGVTLRDVRDYNTRLHRQLNDASLAITTAKAERNQAILEQNRAALAELNKPVEIKVSPRQVFNPRPEPSRARPGAPTSPAPIVTDTGTTYFNAATTDCSPSTSSADSGSCGGGE